MGRHRMPDDPAQSDEETLTLPTVVADPTPGVRGRHRGTERASRRGRIWPQGVSDGGDHEAKPEARGHRTAPYVMHTAAGVAALLAVGVSLGVARDTRIDTARPDTAPIQGRFVSGPSPAPGTPAVTSGPVASTTGAAATPSRPVTGGQPRPSTSTRHPNPLGGVPDRPRLAGSPSASPSPSEGGPSVTPSSAPADPSPTGQRRKCKKRQP